MGNSSPRQREQTNRVETPAYEVCSACREQLPFGTIQAGRHTCRIIVRNPHGAWTQQTANTINPSNTIQRPFGNQIPPRTVGTDVVSCSVCGISLSSRELSDHMFAHQIDQDDGTFRPGMMVVRPDTRQVLRPGNQAIEENPRILLPQLRAGQGLGSGNPREGPIIVRAEAVSYTHLTLPTIYSV
eukprot:TRINITY_DN3550_c0_g1_i11.p1 TRINITY_DN3550_c0_g1~~TRINITY_DN3550_c0_g1_i11.p1  ORF type:complete len:185 (-),score=15.49 TRINITY_DN3550_c0_g1_i11:35-589(-)